MKREIMLYDYPDSMVCRQCPHSYFIIEKNDTGIFFGSVPAICLRNSSANNGEECKDKKLMKSTATELTREEEAKMVCPKCHKKQHCPCKHCKPSHEQEITWKWLTKNGPIACGHCGHTMSLDEWDKEGYRQHEDSEGGN